MFRAVISAVPFLLPLLFQLGFGWTAAEAGLVVIALFAGNVGIKPLTTPLMRRFGIRTVMVCSVAGSAATLVGIAFLQPTTPLPVTLALLALSGVFRSVGFTTYNSVAFADVAPDRMTSANTLMSTLQDQAQQVLDVLLHLPVTVVDDLDGYPGPGGRRARWAGAGRARAALRAGPRLAAGHRRRPPLPGHRPVRRRGRAAALTPPAPRPRPPLAHKFAGSHTRPNLCAGCTTCARAGQEPRKCGWRRSVRACRASARSALAQQAANAASHCDWSPVPAVRSLSTRLE